MNQYDEMTVEQCQSTVSDVLDAAANEASAKRYENTASLVTAANYLKDNGWFDLKSAT